MANKLNFSLQDYKSEELGAVQVSCKGDKSIAILEKGTGNYYFVKEVKQGKTIPVRLTTKQVRVRPVIKMAIIAHQYNLEITICNHFFNHCRVPTSPTSC